jgi:PHD/YefM family antitoxin component YafN of YafNO toxin-antitoxin module
MANITVTSGDFLRQYGRITEQALREPVSITSHGRERLVLLSADEYRRLKKNDRVALRPWELSEEDLAAIKAAEPPPEAYLYDHEVE